MVTRVPEPLADKLNRHRIVQDGCWGWTGSKHKFGYGWIRHGSKTLVAHRVAYELAHGSLPKGAVVRHSCDNPECTNPAHLLSGTHADNMADKVARKRHYRGDQHHWTRITEAQMEQVPAMRQRGMSWAAIGRELGVARSAVRTRYERANR